jgi:hypothetical protein
MMLSVTPDLTPTQLDDEAAYALALPIAASVPEDELVHINVDVRAVAGAVLVRGERLVSLMRDASTLLPGHAQADFHALPVLARGALRGRARRS